MRLDRIGNGDNIVVVLSRRNLLSLVAKLDGKPANSACTLIGGAGAIGLTLRAEEDAEHYAHPFREGTPAGPMHRDTEAAIA